MWNKMIRINFIFKLVLWWKKIGEKSKKLKGKKGLCFLTHMARTKKALTFKGYLGLCCGRWH